VPAKKKKKIARHSVAMVSTVEKVKQGRERESQGKEGQFK
jgi:hypothetical protein